jgi:Cdc6-like AAA superfamily ATPase
MDFALRLKKEDGIALNSALIENLYLNFICIMTKTPLFITGKPGTSKTLSANMIVANLRGAKAHDAYIQTL